MAAPCPKASFPSHPAHLLTFGKGKIITPYTIETWTKKGKAPHTLGTQVIREAVRSINTVSGQAQALPTRLCVDMLQPVEVNPVQ